MEIFKKALGLSSEASIILNDLKLDNNDDCEKNQKYLKFNPICHDQLIHCLIQKYLPNKRSTNEIENFNGNSQLNDGIDCSSGVQQLSFFEKDFVFRVDHFLLEF
ncbi:hypothetical protein ACTFIR_011689 [Dictyostelium discoideum]